MTQILAFASVGVWSAKIVMIEAVIKIIHCNRLSLTMAVSLASFRTSARSDIVRILLDLGRTGLARRTLIFLKIDRRVGLLTHVEQM